MELTEEQKVEVEKIRQKWINRQTEQLDDDFIIDAVNRVWARRGSERNPEVTIVPSIKAAKDALPNGQTYVAIWWRSWSGWYEAAKYLGAEMDEDCLRDLSDFSRACPYLRYDDDTLQVFVSRNPVEVHIEDDQLHNDSGPSMVYADGFKLYDIEGVSVDEQIVMSPETQTIEQIHNEENEEVRRIRIDRFGWMRYLEESEAKVLDHRRNDIECTYEVLAETPVGKRLITFCPSTGRRYALGIPDDEDVTNCEQAQNRLWGDRSGEDGKEVYWIGRT